METVIVPVQDVELFHQLYMQYCERTNAGVYREAPGHGEKTIRVTVAAGPDILFVEYEPVQ